MPNTLLGELCEYGTFENKNGEPPCEEDEGLCVRPSTVDQPLSVVVGEACGAEGDVILVFRILLDGFITYRALLVLFLRSAEAMRLATAV